MSIRACHHWSLQETSKQFVFSSTEVRLWKEWTEKTDCFLLGEGDVGRWGGNLQYLCSDGKCFDFVVFLLGSVTIYSTLIKSNLVLINSPSSIFNIESSGARQMTKINKHNKAEYPNWPEESWPSNWKQDYQETNPIMAWKVEGGEDTGK